MRVELAESKCCLEYGYGEKIEIHSLGIVVMKKAPALPACRFQICHRSLWEFRVQGNEFEDAPYDSPCPLPWSSVESL